MIKTVLITFVLLTRLFAVTEDAPFRNLQSHVSRIVTEWQNLESSTVGYKNDAKEAMTTFISLWNDCLRPGDSKKALDLIKMIDEGLGGSHPLKFWFATTRGFPVDWPIPHYRCGGHEPRRNFSFHSEAISFGDQKREEIHRRSESFRITKPICIDELKFQEILLSNISMVIAASSGLTALYWGGKKLVEALSFDSYSGNSLKDVLVVSTTFACVVLAGKIFRDTLKRYNRISYDVTWGYCHHDDCLSDCDNKKEYSVPHSTQRMLELLDDFTLNLKLSLTTQRMNNQQLRRA